MAKRIEMDTGDIEGEHVQAVYDTIASHFSDTRFSPWPVVTRFLKSFPPGTLLLDAGCGNGKYMKVAPHRPIFGCDTCLPLLEITAATYSGSQLAVSDVTALPYRDGSFDALICIAVIHHLSSVERRAASIREMARVVRKGGKCLVFVWAYEQPKRAKWTPIDDAAGDYMVPWHDRATGKVLDRYYHLFRYGELEELIRNADAGVDIEEFGFDYDNHYAVFVKRG
jgi:tRNA (uracil-5-)-methyltransferase TRM9